MTCVVMKFGGASVSDNERLLRVARMIVAAGEPVVVVVSAQQGQTDRLISRMQSLTDSPPADALDVLKSVGEIQSAALLAAAVARLGVAAEVVPPWQVIRTDAAFGAATIETVFPETLLERLKRRVVPVVPGFIGATADGRITTLGRGGSDYTAVAIGVALRARHVELCKAEVDGIYDADPHADRSARRYDALTHEEALRLARSGARVLQAKAAELALRWRLQVVVRPTFGVGPGTAVGAETNSPQRVQRAQRKEQRKTG